MQNDRSSQMRKELHDLDGLLKEVLQSNFLPDKIYTQITAKIGYIDDVYRKSESEIIDRKYLDWVKKRLERISHLLINLQKHSMISLTVDQEDLMHPSGDYYNEDNSITLTEDNKSELLKILKDQY